MSTHRRLILCLAFCSGCGVFDGMEKEAAGVRAELDEAIREFRRFRRAIEDSSQDIQRRLDEFEKDLDEFKALGDKFHDSLTDFQRHGLESAVELLSSEFRSGGTALIDHLERRLHTLADQFIDRLFQRRKKLTPLGRGVYDRPAAPARPIRLTAVQPRLVIKPLDWHATQFNYPAGEALHVFGEGFAPASYTSIAIEAFD